MPLKESLRRNLTWRDLRDMLFFMVGLVGLGPVQSFLSSISPMVDFIPLITAIFGSLFIVGSISWFWRQVTKLIRARNTRGVVVTFTQIGEHSFEEFLAGAKREIDIAGICLPYVAHYGWKVIEDAIERGVHVKLSVLNPHASDLIARYEEARTTQGTGKPWLADLINSSLTVFCRKRNGLSARDRERLWIGVYESLPIHTLTVVDPDSEDAKIKVEYLWFEPDTSWPTFIVSKKENERTFRAYLASYSAMKGVEYSS